MLIHQDTALKRIQRTLMNEPLQPQPMGEGTRLPMVRGFGKTERIDQWWKAPLLTFLFLATAIAYATWRGFMEADFWIFSDFGRSAGTSTMAIENQGSHVLSPLYSPLIIPGEGGLGSMVPEALLWLSPAMIILVVPAGFRGTCYYYRKAYYRSFMASPPACSVSTPFGDYNGERRLFLFQNLHRYFMYLAVAWLFILAYDVWAATRFHGTDGTISFGISIGTLVLLLNVILLGGYTLGCHSFRHIIGGRKNRFRGTAGKVQEACWKGCTQLNKRHMAFAWCSLFWVMFSDFYVWMCTSGIWTDVVLIGGI